jgi:hypothetical protein
MEARLLDLSKPAGGLNYENTKENKQILPILQKENRTKNQRTKQGQT